MRMPGMARAMASLVMRIPRRCMVSMVRCNIVSCVPSFCPGPLFSAALIARIERTLASSLACACARLADAKPASANNVQYLRFLRVIAELPEVTVYISRRRACERPMWMERTGLAARGPQGENAVVYTRFVCVQQIARRVLCIQQCR
jgi:hypothetical protein